MKYILEPLLFAFDQNTTEDELVEYLAELINLDDWWTNHKDEMYVLSNTGDVLCENGYYPLIESLKPLLDKYGIDFISYKDIGRMLDKYLNKSKYIDEVCNEQMIGLNGWKYEKPLTSDVSSRPKLLHEQFENILWDVACMRMIKEEDAETYVTIAKGISEDIKVKFKYETIETVDGKEVLLEKEECAVIYCKSSLTDFLKNAKTPFLIWKFAESKDDLDLGVRISVYQAKNMTSLDEAYVNYNFVIQQSFYDDFENGHYKNRESDITSTLQALTDAVTDKNLRKMHAIREGKSGASKDLVVNGYDAKRRDITTSIKVAYWKKGKEFRIANMKEHDLVGISEEW